MKLLFSSVIFAAAAQDYYADYYAYNGTDVDYGTGEDGAGDARGYAPDPAYPAQPAYPAAPTYPAASYGGKMSCWHCDAMSFEECERKGEERQCHDNEVSLNLIYTAIFHFKTLPLNGVLEPKKLKQISIIIFYKGDLLLGNPRAPRRPKVLPNLHGLQVGGRVREYEGAKLPKRQPRLHPMSTRIEVQEFRLPPVLHRTQLHQAPHLVVSDHALRMGLQWRRNSLLLLKCSHLPGTPEFEKLRSHCFN